VEYKTKNINIFLNPVDVSKIKKEEIKKYSLENMEYFQNLNDSNGNYIGYNFIKSETINFNPIKELENEINFIKKRYKILLDNLCNNIDGAEIDVKLIRLSFQKVFFYLQILKKKQILNEAMKFFKKENERNKLIENQLKENINNFQNLLSENLKEIKGDLKNIDD
jgi:SpoVK/Ycf46/Vps4 family AAA+-type ATPase